MYGVECTTHVNEIHNQILTTFSFQDLCQKKDPFVFVWGCTLPKTNMEPENAWKRETIYEPSNFSFHIRFPEGCRSPGEPILFTPSGFHQVFLQTFGRPIVGPLECFRLKDEDVLLLSRKNHVLFPSLSMRCGLLGGKKSVCLSIATWFMLCLFFADWAGW